MPTPTNRACTSVRVQVFVDAESAHGNPLTIVPDTASWSDQRCLEFAAQTGTSETVFVDDVARARVRIFVPTRRVPFAGHPVIGTAWWLAQTRGRDELTHLRVDAGEIPVTATSQSASLRTRPFQGVPWRFEHLENPQAVDRASTAGEARHDYLWAWSDESAGCVRARAMTSVSGTAEDEATGSAAIDLCATLGRDLVIQQGRGSQLRTRWCAGIVELSGRCTLGATAEHQRG